MGRRKQRGRAVKALSRKAIVPDSPPEDALGGSQQSQQSISQSASSAPDNPSNLSISNQSHQTSPSVPIALSSMNPTTSKAPNEYPLPQSSSRASHLSNLSNKASSSPFMYSTVVLAARTGILDSSTDPHDAKGKQKASSGHEDPSEAGPSLSKSILGSRNADPPASFPLASSSSGPLGISPWVAEQIHQLQSVISDQANTINHVVEERSKSRSSSRTSKSQTSERSSRRSRSSTQHPLGNDPLLIQLSPPTATIPTSNVTRHVILPITEETEPSETPLEGQSVRNDPLALYYDEQNRPVYGNKVPVSSTSQLLRNCTSSSNRSRGRNL